MSRESYLNYCANGHVMTIRGGTNCGCFPDATCSLPVFSCEQCGDSDYGENEIARLRKAACREARQCRTQAEFYESLPPLHMTRTEFDELDEYSATHPTGVRVGKRWKRHDGAYDPACKKPVWIVGEYVELFGRPNCVTVKWRVPVIRVDAALAGAAL